MFVCLFVCSLCIWTQYVSVQPNFPGILYSTRRRTRAIFFPKISCPSPLPEDPLDFQPMELQIFRFQVENKSLQVFEGTESESGIHLGEILLVDSEPIEIHFLRNLWISKELSQKQYCRGFQKRRFEFDVQSPWKPFGWLTADRNQGAEIMADLYRVFAKTLFLGFLEKASANTISTCREILWVGRKSTEIKRLEKGSCIGLTG